MDLSHIDPRSIQKQHSEYYEKLHSYKKETGRDLPFLIADEQNKKQLKTLLDELMGVLGGDEWSAAHFLLEQMVSAYRIADWMYINLAESELEDSLDVDELVDSFAASADDLMITAGYLLDISYGMMV